MSQIIDFLRTETFLIITASLNIILLIAFLCNFIKIKALSKRYNSFIKKLSNANNIEDMFKKYIDKVENVDEQNKQIISYCKAIENNVSKCIQKIGIVRYSAFKDTGSDLSFALALLDDNNNGVVLNGIYSREMSNIYAKQITNGESNNTLSEEEKTALNIAISSKPIKG